MLYFSSPFFFVLGIAGTLLSCAIAFFLSTWIRNMGSGSSKKVALAAVAIVVGVSLAFLLETLREMNLAEGNGPDSQECNLIEAVSVTEPIS
jgi:hypothetical protein